METKQGIKMRSWPFAAVVSAAAAVIFVIMCFLGRGALAASGTGGASRGGPDSARFIQDGGHYSSWDQPSKSFKLPPEYSYGVKTTAGTQFSVTGKTSSKSAAVKGIFKEYKDKKGKRVRYYSDKTASSGNRLINDPDNVVWKITDNRKGGISMTASGLNVWNNVKHGYDRVDRVMTVTDWTNARDASNAAEMVKKAIAGPYIIISKSSNPIVIINGVDEVSIRYRYYHAGTKNLYTYGNGKELAVGMTIGDIDMGQSVTVEGSGSFPVKYMTLTPDTNLDYIRKSSSVTFRQPKGKEALNNDSEKDTAAVYMNSSDYTMKLSSGWQTDKSDKFYHKQGLWSGFNTAFQGLDPVIPSDPQKSVGDDDEKENDRWNKRDAEKYTSAFASEDSADYSYRRSNVLAAGGKGSSSRSFTYHIRHTLSGMYNENTKITYYVMNDHLDKRIDPEEIKVLRDGSDVTGEFEVTKSEAPDGGTDIKAALKSPSLSNTNGKSYELRIRASVLSDFRGIFKKQEFENVANVELKDVVGNSWTGNDSLKTLKTVTVLDGMPDGPVKKVSDYDNVTKQGQGAEKGVTENTLAGVSGKFTYEIKKEWSNAESDGGKSFVKSFGFVDTMSPVIDAGSCDVTIVTAGNKDITKEFEVKKENHTISAKALDPGKGGFAEAVEKKEAVYMMIDASLRKKDGSFPSEDEFRKAGLMQEDGTARFENMAAAVVNEYPQNTGSVYTNVNFPSAAIEKTSDKAFAAEGDKLHYTVKAYVKDKGSAVTEAYVEDKGVDEKLGKLDPASIKVTFSDGRKEPEFTVEHKGNAIRVSTKEMKKGTSCTLDYDVTVSKNVKSDDLVNKAVFGSAETGKIETEHSVPLLRGPEKTVSDSDDVIMQRYDKGEWKTASGAEKKVAENTVASPEGSWTYHIRASVPKASGEDKSAEWSFVLTDDINEHLTFDKDAVKVLSGSGEDISGMFSVTAEGNRLTAALNKEAPEKGTLPSEIEVDVPVKLKESEADLKALKEKGGTDFFSEDGKYIIFYNEASVTLGTGGGKTAELKSGKVRTNVLLKEEKPKTAPPEPQAPVKEEVSEKTEEPEIIEKAEKTEEPEKPEKTEKPVKPEKSAGPKTGDSAGGYLYMVLLIQALCAVVLFIRIREKYRK
ncbi:MAG: isopeptide-forming domain-containing fimbrial protein [Anaerovoracaceae bacterium]